MKRRELFAQLGKVALAFTGGFAALWGGLRCIRVCMDLLPGAGPARTFNHAIDRQRSGRERRREARDAFERADWGVAESRYHEAHNEYYRAWQLYRRAREGARSADCPSLAGAAAPYITYCDHMEDACDALSTAAARYGDDEEAAGDRRRAEGIEERERATAAVESAFPERRNPRDPCR